MTLTLAGLNALPTAEAAARFRSCCGSSRWADMMTRRRPFENLPALLEAADEAWGVTGPPDWDEAFAHHPRIGERRAEAAMSDEARDWSAGEQRAAAAGPPETRAALAQATRAYEARFGRIYLVCAAGRSAAELLDDIEARMQNDPERERAIAVEEQRKITRLRLEALLGASHP